MTKKKQDDVVSLKTLQAGAAVEMFDDALKEVLKNISDPNTEASAKRTITLTVELVPDIDRESARVTVGVKKGLAPQAKQISKVYVGRDGDEYIAVESNPRQGGLFDAPASAEADEDDDEGGDGETAQPGVVKLNTQKKAVGK